MKAAIINTYCDGSTGTIAEEISDKLKENNFETRLFYGRKQKESKWEFIGEGKLRLILSNFLTFVTGKIGSFHNFSTRKLINQISLFKPDVIHVHNIHGNFLNFKMFFKFLESYKGKVIFTLHDEFLLTGRCALCFCDKWKNGCNHCKFKKAYPRCLIDRSKKLQQNKFQFLERISDLTLVTPSYWLENLVKSSKLNKFKCLTIHNGISNPNPEVMDLTNIIDNKKKNILFAAFTWSVNKGINIINEASNLLDSTKYNIIVAGVDNSNEALFDNRIKKVPLLERNKLMFLLKNVDLFINPTFKDNLPTILIESIILKTPVISFNTGGCSEIIGNQKGVLIDNKNSRELVKNIENFDYEKYLNNLNNLNFNEFSIETMCQKYLNLYKDF